MWSAAFSYRSSILVTVGPWPGCGLFARAAAELGRSDPLPNALATAWLHVTENKRRTVSLAEAAYLDHDWSHSAYISASSLSERTQDIGADPEPTPKLPWTAGTEDRSTRAWRDN